MQIKLNIKYTAELITGIAGGILIGILGLMAFMNLGGNYGCAPIIDKLTGEVGYESCGAFGTLAGVLLGSIVGTTLLHRTYFTNRSYLRIIITSLLLAVLPPLGLAWLMVQREALSLAIPAISLFALFSLVPSAIMTVILNLKIKAA